MTSRAGIGRRRKKHFRNRLMDRFGITITITDEEIVDLTDEIYNYRNKPVLILEENGNSFHLVSIQGTDLIVLFDWECHVPLTVYYRSWLKEDHNGEYQFHYKCRSKDTRIKNKADTFTQKTGIRNQPTNCLNT